VTSEEYPKWFYYQWCKYHLDRFIAIAQAHATTMGHIKRKDLDNALCFIPSDTEFETMNEQMSPLLAKMENNSKQIKSLENMRDTLLPKLMSGEIRIKDVL
jgi:type I restriction enzyme S subunit